MEAKDVMCDLASVLLAGKPVGGGERGGACVCACNAGVDGPSDGVGCAGCGGCALCAGCAGEVVVWWVSGGDVSHVLCVSVCALCRCVLSVVLCADGCVLCGLFVLSHVCALACCVLCCVHAG